MLRIHKISDPGFPRRDSSSVARINQLQLEIRLSYPPLWAKQVESEDMPASKDFIQLHLSTDTNSTE
jgi:hypothetical protein